MKYRKLWALAFVCIVLDFIITVVAIQFNTFHEVNENAVLLMEQFGQIAGLLLTVLMRFCVLSVGILMQRISPRFDSIPIMFLLPPSVVPVIWNTYIILRNVIPNI